MAVLNSSALMGFIRASLGTSYGLSNWLRRTVKSVKLDTVSRGFVADRTQISTAEQAVPTVSVYLPYNPRKSAAQLLLPKRIAAEKILTQVGNGVM